MSGETEIPEAAVEALDQMAAEEGPRWSSRKLAWLDGYRHGEQHARLTRQEEDRPSLEAAWRERLLSDEAIEAGAEAAHKLFSIYPWVEISDEAKRNNRRAVRKAIQAALSVTEQQEGD